MTGIKELAQQQRTDLFARLGNTPVDAWQFNGIEAAVILSCLAAPNGTAELDALVKACTHAIEAMKSAAWDEEGYCLNPDLDEAADDFSKVIPATKEQP